MTAAQARILEIGAELVETREEAVRLRAALTARDEAIRVAEEALMSADTVLWLNPDVDRMELSGILDYALSALAAAKESR